MAPRDYRDALLNSLYAQEASREIDVRKSDFFMKKKISALFVLALFSSSCNALAFEIQDTELGCPAWANSSHELLIRKSGGRMLLNSPCGVGSGKGQYVSYPIDNMLIVLDDARDNVTGIYKWDGKTGLILVNKVPYESMLSKRK